MAKSEPFENLDEGMAKSEPFENLGEGMAKSEPLENLGKKSPLPYIGRGHSFYLSVYVPPTSPMARTFPSAPSAVLSSIENILSSVRLFIEFLTPGFLAVSALFKAKT